MFIGRGLFNLDAKLSKAIRIREGKELTLRMDAFNVLNHPTFWSGDQNINDPTFGVMSSMFYRPRVIQLGAHFSF